MSKEMQTQVSRLVKRIDADATRIAELEERNEHIRELANMRALEIGRLEAALASEKKLSVEIESAWESSDRDGYGAWLSERGAS